MITRGKGRVRGRWKRVKGDTQWWEKKLTGDSNGHGGSLSPLWAEEDSDRRMPSLRSSAIRAGFRVPRPLGHFGGWDLRKDSSPESGPGGNQLGEGTAPLSLHHVPCSLAHGTFSIQEWLAEKEEGKGKAPGRLGPPCLFCLVGHAPFLSAQGEPVLGIGVGRRGSWFQAEGQTVSLLHSVLAAAKIRAELHSACPRSPAS